MAPFAELSPEEQAAVREAQRRRKLDKKSTKTESNKKLQKTSGVPEAKQPQGVAEVVAAKVGRYRDKISMEEYFSSCPYSLFREPSMTASEENLERLMAVLAIDPGLQQCNYFQFSGKKKDIWNPRFNARLAHEGFFTITTCRGKDTEPLPELQPFYSVVAWPLFEESKHVRKALSRLSKSERRFRLANNENPERSWSLLDAYHRKKYGVNWLTKEYFDMIWAGSCDATVNFTVHCFELYDNDSDDGSEEEEESSSYIRVLSGYNLREKAKQFLTTTGICRDKALPLAGEIGFSIGGVYTSLSGWTAERTNENLGTSQLVLLGKWLQKKGYAFWSMGHCYSPHMEYKRELGHRVLPRQDFLSLLKAHRGSFVVDARSRSAPLCESFASGESCAAEALLA